MGELTQAPSKDSGWSDPNIWTIAQEKRSEGCCRSLGSRAHTYQQEGRRLLGGQQAAPTPS